MQWIEFVHVRASAAGMEWDLSSLNAQLALCRSEQLAEVSVVKHALYPGDLAVILTWQNDRHPVKTREGMAIAEYLNRFGAVEHGVWEYVAIQQFNKANGHGLTAQP